MIRKSLSYVVVNALGVLSGFILFPLYTEYLPTEDFGNYALIVSATAFGSLISGFGITNTMSNFYFDLKSNDRNKILRELLSYTTFANLFIGLLVASVVSLSGWYEPRISILLVLGLLLGFSDSILAMYYQFLRNQGENRTYLGINYVYIILSFLVTLLLLNLGFALWSVVLGKLVVGVCIYSIIAFKHLTFKIDYKFLRPMAKYGMKLIPVLFLGWVFQYSDRFIVEQYLSRSMFGSFGFIVSTSYLVITGYLAVSNAILPDLYLAFKDNNHSDIAKIIRHYLIMLFAGSIGFYLTIIGIYFLWTSFKFHADLAVLALFAGGVFILGILHLVNMELSYYKQIKRITLYQNISYASYSVMIIPLFKFGFGNLYSIATWFIVSRILSLLVIFLLERKLHFFSRTRALVLSAVVLIFALAFIIHGFLS